MIAIALAQTRTRGTLACGPFTKGTQLLREEMTVRQRLFRLTRPAYPQLSSITRVFLNSSMARDVNTYRCSTDALQHAALVADPDFKALGRRLGASMKPVAVAI